MAYIVTNLSSFNFACKLPQITGQMRGRKLLYR
jgi:hypothetical protein